MCTRAPRLPQHDQSRIQCQSRWSSSMNHPTDPAAKSKTAPSSRAGGRLTCEALAHCNCDQAKPMFPEGVSRGMGWSDRSCPGGGFVMASCYDLLPSSALPAGASATREGGRLVHQPEDVKVSEAFVLTASGLPGPKVLRLAGGMLYSRVRHCGFLSSVAVVCKL